MKFAAITFGVQLFPCFEEAARRDRDRIQGVAAGSVREEHWFSLTYFFRFCQALLHASVALDRKLVVDWVPSCDLEDSAAEEVSFLYLINCSFPYLRELTGTNWDTVAFSES